MMEELLSQAIHQLGAKWNFGQDCSIVIQNSCKSKKNNGNLIFKELCSISIAVLFMLITPCTFGLLNIYARYGISHQLTEDKCLLMVPQWIHYSIHEPAANCHSFCQDLKEITKVDKISQKEFLEKFAYSGRPLLIHNATNGWKAFETFSFSFFKQVFQLHAEKLAELMREDKGLWQICPFLGYKTEFQNLADFFNMSQARSQLGPLEKSYYVGFSTCFPHIVDVLRNYYTWPDFLPSDHEKNAVDFIFMGSSKKESEGGARVHLDYGADPSWQAVVSGKKQCRLRPPPECENICVDELEVNMEKGDMLVLETGLWFHATKAYPDVLTITIGSDFN